MKPREIKISVITILAVMLCTIALSPNAHAYDAEKEIDKFIALPEDEIDIGIIALTLSKEVYPEIDIQGYSKKIDKMVSEIKVLTKGSKDPDYRVRALNTYLYRKKGFKYDMKDVNAMKVENRFLTGILDTKKGSCVTLPLLYLVLAQRLDYPVYPVPAPAHLFLRYVDPKMPLPNIEATGGGGYSPNEEYIYTLNISEKSIKNGVYMRNLSYHEFIADLITENGAYWARKGDLDRGIRYLEKAVEVNPKAADIWNLLGAIIREYLIGKYNTPENQKLFERSLYSFQKAKDLGVTTISNDGYVEKQKQRQKDFRGKEGQ